VITLEEKRVGTYYKRKFQIRCSYDQESVRTVYHLHYVEWPDHGVPLITSGLFYMLREMNDCCKEGSGGPPIVHCSAGVGRTGTFLQLEHLTRMNTDHLSIQQNVEHMRRQRVHMVQSVDQYVLLYKLTTEHHLLKKTDQTLDKLSQHLELISLDQKEMNKEFDLSTLISPQQHRLSIIRDHPEIKMYHHSKINFCKSMIGGEEVPYNGSFVEVYGLDQKVMVLNDPHNFANDDFWLTCVANNVEVLLTIGEDKHTKLIPEDAGKSLILAPMCKLTLNNSEVKDHVTTNHLTLEQTAKQMKIKQVELREWPDEDNLYLLTDIMTSLEGHLKMAGNKTLAIHSRTGDHLSCMFVAIWNLKKRLDVEGRFDVMRTCKDLHDMKKNALPSSEYYQKLYSFLRSYLMATDNGYRTSNS